MGGKKKYINIFGSFTEPFNSLPRYICNFCNFITHNTLHQHVISTYRPRKKILHQQFQNPGVIFENTGQLNKIWSSRSSLGLLHKCGKCDNTYRCLQNISKLHYLCIDLAFLGITYCRLLWSRTNIVWWKERWSKQKGCICWPRSINCPQRKLRQSKQSF